jgi:hypothetical protein
MKKISLLLYLLIGNQFISAQDVKYSTAWFGPNALPVPEFTDASIPAKTTFNIMGDYYYGFGDKTKNGYLKVEIPLLPERVSLKVWATAMEHFETTAEVMQKRGATAMKGSEFGDIYVQTRMLICTEKEIRPSIILNTTLRTASPKTVLTRRYFDTPGYYFDTEIGKSFQTGASWISHIRTVVNGGFICWETAKSIQDEGPLYGGKIIIGNPNWNLENTISGYWGWMHTNKASPDYGDAPAVWASKINIIGEKLNYFAQYQYGIRDFPFHQIRVGVNFQVESLTPRYNP